jgi:hypothetical protein
MPKRKSPPKPAKLVLDPFTDSYPTPVLPPKELARRHKHNLAVARQAQIDRHYSKKGK